MKAQRLTNRRSFLRRVGATATAGAALAVVGGSEAGAQNNRYSGVTDCDTGNGADRPGYGTGNRNQFTDQDTGPSADPRCHGRGSNNGANSGTRYNPVTQPNTGCSDSDYGPQGDPGGHGRACRGYEPNPYAPQVSGCSDNDPASTGDSVGNGRHCTPR
ncbi:hypothetical protein [Allosphingosinicella sp.]|uniref:hypothetical protein n=1 Tax=Allosphingosinicella sp. TaxID=2823234 RepID=UPI003783F9CD